MIERVFAGIALAACALLLLRLVVGERRHWRFDAAMRRAWVRCRRGLNTVRHWRTARRQMGQARKLADEAIARARRGGPVRREGNVYSPKSFRKPPRDKMH